MTRRTSSTTSAFIDNTFNSLFITPYATANTVNYTNYGVLGALEGFRFDTFNTHTARYTTAGTLYNGVGAVINCGGTNDGPYFATNAFFFFSATARYVWPRRRISSTGARLRWGRTAC